jgi:hypothetical protein
MRWKTLPVNGLIPGLLVLLLGCGSLGAWAQEESEPEPDTGTSTTAPNTPATTPRTEQPAPDKASENSPFDYQASEEISQDLSVSFPVDI